MLQVIFQPFIEPPIRHISTPFSARRGIDVRQDREGKFTETEKVHPLVGTYINRKSPSTGSTSCLSLTDSSLGGEEFGAVGDYRFVTRNLASGYIQLSFEAPVAEFLQPQSRPSEGEMSEGQRGGFCHSEKVHTRIFWTFDNPEPMI